MFVSSSSKKNGKEEEKEKVEMVGPLDIVSGICYYYCYYYL